MNEWSEAVLAAYDRQVRRQPEWPGAQVERADGVVRVVSDGWLGVVWSDLSENDADAVIAAQIGRFAGLARPWEWKYYSYDRPADLPRRLIAAGFTPDPMETLLVAEIAGLVLDVPPPVGVRLRPVVDEEGVAALVKVSHDVFGGDHATLGDELLARLRRQPDVIPAVLAMAGQTPIAAGRVELHDGTEFASLWGGGTLPGWRGQGVFRSLVAYRAALAAAAGFRYLQVDASAQSEPILRRLGFVALATTTPLRWTVEGS